MRRIDGKTFALHSRHTRKKDAQDTAKVLRSRGHLARVVKRTGEYAVYHKA